MKQVLVPPLPPSAAQIHIWHDVNSQRVCESIFLSCRQKSVLEGHQHDSGKRDPTTYTVEPLTGVLNGKQLFLRLLYYTTKLLGEVPSTTTKTIMGPSGAGCVLLSRVRFALTGKLTVVIF